ncbi:40S ribosomal protein S18-like [Sturnira hondurensis]|uniref:40S ribosomal protein S18-like n=1 Tax=Sturnira hondurensis TaxID=192404 RepID=UPI00187A51F4|nr:40S ribosomal protein S18-like [Sturnira hondurensis]
MGKLTSVSSIPSSGGKQYLTHQAWECFIFLKKNSSWPLLGCFCVPSNLSEVVAHFASAHHQYRWASEKSLRHHCSYGCGRSDAWQCREGRGLAEDEAEHVITVRQTPRQHKIPDRPLNTQKDVRDGKYSQVLTHGLHSELHEDLEWLTNFKPTEHCGHFWGLGVGGQQVRTTAA